MLCQAIDYIALNQDAGDRGDIGLGVFASCRMVDFASEKLMKFLRETHKDGQVEVYGYNMRYIES